MGFPGGASNKVIKGGVACQRRRHKRCVFNPYVGKSPWRRKWQPTPVFLPGEFHGQRSLAGYSPQGHKVLDVTEQLNTHILKSAISSTCTFSVAPGHYAINNWRKITSDLEKRGRRILPGSQTGKVSWK